MFKIRKFSRQQSGFTLIELLVVIFIIGVLTGIILPNFIGSRQRARDARRKEELDNIKNALRLYYNDSQEYPSDLDAVDPDYMSSVPVDPSTGSEYGYCTGSDNDTFVLCAELENAGDLDGVDNQDNGNCPTSICDCGCSNTCYYVCAN